MRIGTLNKRLLAVLLVLTCASGVLAIATFLNAQNTAGADRNSWPSLLMVYNIDGLTYNGVSIREVHRLVYRSKSDWTDTVIESDPIQSGVGTIYSVGSYKRVDGIRYEEYDSIGDQSYLEELDGGKSITIPNVFLQPVPVKAIQASFKNNVSDALGFGTNLGAGLLS